MKYKITHFIIKRESLILFIRPLENDLFPNNVIEYTLKPSYYIVDGDSLTLNLSFSIDNILTKENALEATRIIYQVVDDLIKNTDAKPKKMRNKIIFLLTGFKIK